METGIRPTVQSELRALCELLLLPLSPHHRFVLKCGYCLVIYSTLLDGYINNDDHRVAYRTWHEGVCRIIERYAYVVSSTIRGTVKGSL
jgi:pentatricopeptide repeat protein